MLFLLQTGSIPARCLLEYSTGSMCSPDFRYYYDTATEGCKLAFYSSCGGNANNFEPLQECKETCVSPEPTTTPTPTVEIHAPHGPSRLVSEENMSILAFPFSH